MTRVAVAGLGLIGGSLALGLKARGYDHRASAREAARRRGIDVADTLGEALAGAEIASRRCRRTPRSPFSSKCPARRPRRS